MARQRQECYPKGITGASELGFERLLGDLPALGHLTLRLAMYILLFQRLAIMVRQLGHGRVNQIACLLTLKQFVIEWRGFYLGVEAEQLLIEVSPQSLQG